MGDALSCEPRGVRVGRRLVPSVARRLWPVAREEEQRAVGFIDVVERTPATWKALASRQRNAGVIGLADSWRTAYHAEM